MIASDLATTPCRGFTRGAHDFRSDKPILFIDTDDLIAMQEGRDVLAKAFSGS